MQEFKVKKSDEGVRADIFVASKFPDYARSALKGLFKHQNVHINGQVAKAGYKLKQGDRITVDASLLHAEVEDIELPIIYEDDDVMVIDKPAGLLTHSKGALNLEPTVASFLKKRLNDESLTGNRAGIIHRLDRATSGLIIGAKNSKALAYWQKQFSTRKVKKTYVAIVEGVPKPSAAIIDAPIARNPKKPQTFHVNPLGKPAQTQYRLIQSINKAGKKFSLLELEPLTGRTHQLRVHLAYIGHPIIGDAVYGHSDTAMLLHAQKLELTFPGGELKSFSMQSPKVFRDFIES
ncbi:MAG TPA: RluA family pseudouridine synthase [Candidatus Saccharimonadales bacterium]|nr:RluA family pseudouridine synthase [Candidatus Saccharimonadales bacterium]